MSLTRSEIPPQAPGRCAGAPGRILENVSVAGRRLSIGSLPALVLACLLAFAAGPAFHKADCHAASPSQCPGCLASPVAFHADAPDGIPTALAPAGPIEAEASLAPSAPLLVSLQGRSPPA